MLVALPSLAAALSHGLVKEHLISAMNCTKGISLFMCFHFHHQELVKTSTHTPESPSVVTQPSPSCFSTYFMLLAFVISLICNLWPILSCLKQTSCSQNCLQAPQHRLSLLAHRHRKATAQREKGQISPQNQPLAKFLSQRQG